MRSLLKDGLYSGVSSTKLLKFFQRMVFTRRFDYTCTVIFIELIFSLSIHSMFNTCFVHYLQKLILLSRLINWDTLNPRPFYNLQCAHLQISTITYCIIHFITKHTLDTTIVWCFQITECNCFVFIKIEPIYRTR